MKSNIHKKMTFEDKFDRKYACWVKNNRKAWHYWKRRNRKLFRLMNKYAQDLGEMSEEEINAYFDRGEK